MIELFNRVNNLVLEIWDFIDRYHWDDEPVENW
jgi:hypothetical protein